MTNEALAVVKESKEKLRFNGTVLVIGASGMVGERFGEMYEGKFLTPSSSELDITDAEAVRAYIEREKPDVVINFAAYTDMTASEDTKGTEYRNREGKCWRTNVEGVRNILNAIDPTKTKFIQISTDLVFSGSAGDPGPYSEEHLPERDLEKITWYGFTKAEAERLILGSNNNNWAILRIMYPVRKEFYRKHDYFKKALLRYQQGKLPPLFTDQEISITFVDEACEALARILEGDHRGVFHAASHGTTTPAKIIPYYLEKVLGVKPEVRFGEMGEYAKRFPQHGALKGEKMESIMKREFRTPEQIVQKVT